jgi:hypothetical protein
VEGSAKGEVSKQWAVSREQEEVTMEELWQRIVENLFGRMGGPLHFRIILQPVMAIFFATLDGVKDAKAGKPAYLWAMLTTPENRRELLRDGWKHFGKIFILAIILDVVYQLIVLHTVYPGETLIVALVLAVVPYLLLRGPVNRIVRLFKK